MGLAITTAATTQPLTLEEAKAHLRIDTTDEDPLIASLIVAATEYAEGYMNRTLVNTAYSYTLDGFPTTGTIVLPQPDLLTVASVTYIDTDGNSQTWSSSLYTVKTDTLLGTVEPAYGESFPSTRAQTDAVTVSFTAGYSSAATVPESIKSAIKLVLGHLFEIRESYIVGTNIAANPAADMLLDLNRVMTSH